MKKLMTMFLVMCLALNLFNFTSLQAVSKEAEQSVEIFDQQRESEKDKLEEIIEAIPVQKDHAAELRQMEEEERFKNELKNNLDQIVNECDVILEDENESEENDFTFDGGTKKFLAYDLSAVFPYYQKDYTLRAVGKEVEVWVANDLNYPDPETRPASIITQEQVNKLANEFDVNIFKKDTDFFGMPDARLGENSYFAMQEEATDEEKNYYKSENNKTILLIDNIRDDNYYDRLVGEYIGGFFSTTIEDFCDRNVISVNSRMFEYIVSKPDRINDIYGTIAHEFQHLIHSDNDYDETTWLNEGMSVFAEYLCGYGHSYGAIAKYLIKPENSLVQWHDYSDAEVVQDYGLVYLFMLYVNGLYGKDFVKQVALNDKNSIESINDIFEKKRIKMDFKKLYENFMVAVAIDAPSIYKGIYDVKDINLINDVEEYIKKLLLTEKDMEKYADQNVNIDLNLRFEIASRFAKDGVPAWGADYIALDEQWDNKIHSINFNGIDFMPIEWEIFKTDSGEKVLYSGFGDEKDKQLIVKVDLSNTSEPKLLINTLYDIEEQWDFGIVQISTDKGTTWNTLSNEHSRSDIVAEGYPNIMDRLPGFTGVSGENADNPEFVVEQFDLTPYADSKEVYINFRYMTDWGYNALGWFLSEIAVLDGENEVYYNDCSVLDGFINPDKLVDKNKIRYAVTFVNELPVSSWFSKTFSNVERKYNVLTVEPFNISEQETKELKTFFTNGKTYMLVWYPAENDKSLPAPYDYKIVTYDDKFKESLDKTEATFKEIQKKIDKNNDKIKEEIDNFFNDTWNKFKDLFR